MRFHKVIWSPRKKCPQCNQQQSLSSFFCDKNRKDGHYIYCKTCCKLRQKQHRTKYKKQLALMEHMRNQTETRKQSKRTYKKSKKFKISNKRYERNKKLTDLTYKLKANLRGRFYHAIKDNAKGGSAVRALGCSVSELKVYLESQFQPGMSWDNWSRNGWHIDHVIPLNNFNLSDSEQVKQACHYTNLQPLWAKDNLRKGTQHA